MVFVRSLLFHVLFYSWTCAYCVLMAPGLLLPRGVAVRVAFGWSAGALVITRVVAGISYEVKGRENLPATPVLLAAKHQSAWDTLVFAQIVNDPIYILKEELTRIPVFGWYLKTLDMIAVDREAGASAMRGLVREVRKAIAVGRTRFVIFPEGSRAPVGEKLPYQVGVAGLYAMLEIPVVPVALNSGLFWGRKSFLVHPGKITLEFLPAILPGQKRQAFMTELESAIETTTNRLMEEAK